MKRFSNELKVPERTFRVRLNRLNKLLQLGAPVHALADASWILTQSFKPAPIHVKVTSWVYDNLPEWVKWCISSHYREMKVQLQELEKAAEELDPEQKELISNLINDYDQQRDREIDDDINRG